MNEKITNKLLVYQVPHLLQLQEAMKENDCILDASDTGTGKTYTALALALSLKLKPFIICPKSVIPSWLSVAEHFDDMEIFGIANYELLKGCKYYTQDMERVVCPYMDRILVDEDGQSSSEHMMGKKQNKSKSTDKKKKKKLKEDFIFQLPNDVMIIFDEAHRCKNYKTITSRLLVSIKNSGNKILLLSATISDKIQCFKPFGLVFGFYDSLKRYTIWMRRQIKMNKVQFAKLNLGANEMKLKIIHDNVFPARGSRMKISELGDLFPKNQIVSQSYMCQDYDKVQQLYDIINEALEDLKNKERQSEALGKIIRARQKIEMYKVPIFIDLAEEALDNDYSVVIFVNYKETMYNLADQLKCDCLIHGDQNLDERTSAIEDFQSNKRRILISIIQAGGVGISLHDIHGGHPRMSLISPTWSGQDMQQVLGRIHRAGSKSPALQRLVFCSNTYEDEIEKIINNKITNIKAINDNDMMGPKFNKEKYEEVDDDIATVIDHGDNITDKEKVITEKGDIVDKKKNKVRRKKKEGEKISLKKSKKVFKVKKT